jgi:CubicO group peptidase (beta-lactamase class C family)
MFAIASITKTITSLQLMTLVEDGLVSLEVPVAEYLPEFAANGKASVALWHLLTHTSGISQSANTMEGPAEPGTRVDYFSPGFWVVAEVVSRITGTPYWSHLRSRLLDPIGLKDTGYFAEEEPPRGFVEPRMWPEETQTPLVADAGVIDPRTATMPDLTDHARRARYAAGGMLSTGPDWRMVGKEWCSLEQSN